MAVGADIASAGGALPRSSGKVDESFVKKAVDALLKWTNSQKQKEKAQLLEDDELVYLVVSLKKTPEKGRTNPYMVPLPHPLYQLDGPQEICLIVSDRGNAKEKMDKKLAKERIEKEGLKVAKVIPLSKLRTDYFAFEAKRKLCGSYDLFLADDRILAELPKLLGKTFYKKKRHPIPVNLTRAQWTGQISAACNSTFLYVSGGTCSVVKVARLSQSREEIIANVKAVMDGVAEQVPRKWANVRSLFLKTLESVALPLYQSLPELPMKIDGQGQTLKIDSKADAKMLNGAKNMGRIGGEGKSKNVGMLERIELDGETKSPAVGSKRKKHRNREGKKKKVATGA